MRYVPHEASSSRLLFGTLFLLAVALQAPYPSIAQFDTRSPETRAEVGAPVPGFEITGLRDSSRTLRPSDFEGRYLLLNLWATWCAPCIEKIPQLKRIRNRHDQGTLAILNVSFDKSRAAAIEFLEKRGQLWELVRYREPRGPHAARIAKRYPRRSGWRGPCEARPPNGHTTRAAEQAPPA